METAVITGVYENVITPSTPLSAAVREEKLLDTKVFTVTAEWSQTDLVRGSRLRFLQQWTLVTDPNDPRSITSVSPPGPCVPVSGEILSSFSPVQNLRAVIREAGAHQLLEIWDAHGLQKCLNLTALNKHGRVYEDAQFGALSWSHCENWLLYVAERSRSAAKAERESAWPKDRSVYCEDWGEALSNKSTPVLCVLHLQSGALRVLDGVPAEVSPGQALWAPGGQAVIFVGWYHEPFRLGLKFCSNRRSVLWRLDLEGHCERLSGENLAVSSPRLSPDGSLLVYLQAQVFGPHNQCFSLQMLDLKSSQTSTLVDVVHRPKTGEFAGLYEALPAHCWSADSQRVLFSSACRNRKDLFVVDRASREVRSLSDRLSEENQAFGSWKLLTVQNDVMVVCCSSPCTPPTLRAAVLPTDGGSVTWRTLQEPLRTFDFQWSSLDVEPGPDEENRHYAGLDFGAILVKPSRTVRDEKSPLVVFIHGGPHSQAAAEWSCITAGLAALHFAVLMVNYRGSTGFGQDSILSLLGGIGRQDVSDVQRAVLTALHSDPTLDAKRVAVIGGSHGGFLSCHLVGQYPNFYGACVARNPVINAATLVGTSDIVDWRYTSVGLPYSYTQTPTAEALATMLERSPITHVDQISAPVLLMLGGRDRRVSPHQGLELHKALKSRASPVRLLWFPEDGHSLSRVETQADCFLNTVLWLQQHL
ncbi:S9 family peptidase isoform X2 [Synchiropus splendidus]|uniref:S9 family peptidase isoform X2 n=1 Tax=Synchiropus splendidus TaxID=270530 RepID=UPI00237D7A97|nr:S9 family peptidase isoform X2 [Synchiropus splendidus]